MQSISSRYPHVQRLIGSIEKAPGGFSRSVLHLSISAPRIVSNNYKGRGLYQVLVDSRYLQVASAPLVAIRHGRF